MGIRSEPFRGVVLSGDDIAKFEKQVKNHRPNAAAVATARRGAKLASEFKQTGQVAFVARRKAPPTKAPPKPRAKKSIVDEPQL